MRRLFALACAAVAFGAWAGDSPSPPQFRLPRTARPVAYEVRLAIDPRAEQFSGEVRISLQVAAPVPVLWLNARELSIDDAYFEQDGRRIDVAVVKGGEHFAGLEAKAGTFHAGPAVVHVRYRGTLDANSPQGLFRQQEAGEWYALSQFEAVDARRAFPCFDEPEWKTPWQLTIDAPSADVVVSNTLEKGASPVPGKAGWTRHEFARTRPLPSYLVALAVGPFDVVDGGRAGRNKVPLRIIAPKGRGAEARFAVQSTARLVELLEDYFGIPYPYEKLDSVAIPQSGGYAMENAAMITYDASTLLAKPREETDFQKRIYVMVAAHEIAHQWFGDYVTLAWWDDTWLNEAFATWMEEKIAYRYEPAWNNGYNHAYFRRRAIGADRLASARSIRNPVASYDDIDAAFDPITYEKGGEVLGMFETWLTPELFRTGVRAYLRRHAWGSATSEDFFGALARAAGRPDVVKAFTAYVERPGFPLVHASLQCEPRPVLTLSQQRFKPKGSAAADGQWVTPACLRYPGPAGLATQCVEVGASTAKAPFHEGACPPWIVGNADGRGQYVVRYDDALGKRIAGSFGDVPAPEAVALVGDAALLAESGTIALDEGLRWGEAALSHASPGVKATGVRLAYSLRDSWLDEKQRRAKHALAAGRIVPLARELGWSPRAGEGEETRELRSDALEIAAELDEGAALRDEARSLAMRWIDDRSAIDSDMKGPVLDTAARFADEPTFAKLEGALARIPEARDRDSLARALGRARDPQLRERAFGLVLAKGDGAIGSIHAIDLLGSASRDNANRRAALDFVGANYEAVVRKVPENSLVRVIAAMEGLCTRSDRDAFVGVFASRAPQLVGGPVAYRQSLESIDLCLAARGL